MKMLRLMQSATLALGLACALPTTTYAVVVYDEITVQDAFGTVYASVLATPAQIAADPNAVFYVSGVDVDLTEIGDYGIVVDNDGNSLQIFGIGNGGPDGYDLSFGGAGAASGYFVQNAAADTGAPIDLTQYLAPTLQSLGNTATLFATAPSSGIPPVLTSGVPEPLTWAMMVVGFAAIGSGMRRTAPVRKLAASAR